TGVRQQDRVALGCKNTLERSRGPFLIVPDQDEGRTRAREHRRHNSPGRGYVRDETLHDYLAIEVYGLLTVEVVRRSIRDARCFVSHFFNRRAGANPPRAQLRAPRPTSCA